LNPATPRPQRKHVHTQGQSVLQLRAQRCFAEVVKFTKLNLTSIATGHRQQEKTCIKSISATSTTTTTSNHKLNKTKPKLHPNPNPKPQPQPHRTTMIAMKSRKYIGRKG
jgi:hypothetical protein